MKVMISGASSGIGWEIAAACIKKGDDVIGLARNFYHLPVIDNFTPVEIDLLKINQIKELKKYDPEILVCNVGRALLGNLEQYSFEDIQETVTLNFLSHVYLVKLFLPKMKRRRKGHIVFIGSESAFEGKRKGSVYCASKFALRGFAEAIRDECKPYDISISEIHPGVVKDTRFFDNTDWIPSNNALSPSEVASSVMKIIKKPENFIKINHFQASLKKKKTSS